MTKPISPIYEFMTTFTGRKFHFKDPSPEEICIEDIAHHLSLLCRFTGACRVFYSVAEHGIRVAQLLPKRLQLSGLLHDSPETYINDISRPVKYSHKLDGTEKIIMEAIIDKYGITPYDPEVKEADNILCATEGRDLMANTDDWQPLPEPINLTIEPVSSTTAESRFLRLFELYGGKQ